jgi:hypothetical protein
MFGLMLGIALSLSASQAQPPQQQFDTHLREAQAALASLSERLGNQDPDVRRLLISLKGIQASIATDHLARQEKLVLRQLAAAQLTLQDLQARNVSPKHPDMIRIQQAIRFLREQLAALKVAK